MHDGNAHEYNEKIILFRTMCTLISIIKITKVIKKLRINVQPNIISKYVINAKL